ncbi:succinate dehydrogenase assembly factor 2 [Isoalcanivorax indicus]|uniref:FAD assembly factor SdhE n=1 Tax=Isoalcanivorax indicus TaxID=2202653 RepID=UPI000DB92D13|nr:succinate dehydrogenase assembly factor 2 [Isoalcanivorax indicus]
MPRLTAEERKRRLVWQCRRGLLETDVVLNAYLDEHFLHDTSAHQQTFERLLACQDADLFEWFTRRSRPDDGELDAFVRHMLTLVGAKD